MRHDVPTRLHARPTAEAPRNFAGVGLAHVLTALLTLSACSPAEPATSNVLVTSSTVAPQGPPPPPFGYGVT